MHDLRLSEGLFGTQDLDDVIGTEDLLASLKSILYADLKKSKPDIYASIVNRSIPGPLVFEHEKDNIFIDSISTSGLPSNPLPGKLDYKALNDFSKKYKKALVFRSTINLITITSYDNSPIQLDNLRLFIQRTSKDGYPVIQIGEEGYKSPIQINNCELGAMPSLRGNRPDPSTYTSFSLLCVNTPDLITIKNTRIWVSSIAVGSDSVSNPEPARFINITVPRVSRGNLRLPISPEAHKDLSIKREISSKELSQITGYPQNLFDSYSNNKKDPRRLFSWCILYTKDSWIELNGEDPIILSLN